MKEIEELLKEGYKNLIAGTEVKPMVKGVFLKAGQGILKAGSVLGISTADNVGILLNKSATDGSQTPSGILIEEVDTGTDTDADSILSQIAIRGVFNQEALLFAEGTNLSDMEIELRKIDIYTRKMY